MQELMTIGYEGSKIEEFVDALISSDVKILIDVRELPLSRKKGFSKKSLKSAVEKAGIRYEHFRGLGDPKPGRMAARSGDYNKFRKIFKDHLDSEVGQTAVNEVVPLVEKGGACLLCFERCHKSCHRLMVAEEIITRTKMKLRHIGVENDEQSGASA